MRQLVQKSKNKTEKINKQPKEGQRDNDKQIVSHTAYEISIIGGIIFMDFL